MRVPKPRNAKYFGAECSYTYAANGTWLEAEELCYPSGAMLRRAYAICEDGIKRVVRCGIADTFFSIPANVRIKGKYTVGFVSIKDDAIHFTAYKGDK